VAHDLFGRQRIDGYMFDVEVLYLARARGYRIKQVGVRWRDDGDTRLDLVAGNWRNMLDLCRIRLGGRPAPARGAACPRRHQSAACDYVDLVPLPEGPMLHDWLLSRASVFEWQQRLCNNYGAIRRHFRQHLDLAGMDILDVGCSTGTCAATVVSMDRNRYVGIDVVPEYVERAARRCPAGKFLTMDARRLDFPDASFDVVLFVAVLHHMEDGLIHDCLRDTRRVLRPDGVVLCAEPVFTRGKPLSTLLLTFDRGGYIRTEAGYRALFDGFTVTSPGYLWVSLHRFCSFELRKPAASAAA
jgi:SAM-dependent methyltransferase